MWEETLIFDPVCNNFDKNFEENINDYKLKSTVPVIKSYEVIWSANGSIHNSYLFLEITSLHDCF